MSLLADRLKGCRKNKNKTQKDLANFLGISERGYQNYEIGQREPSIETLNKLADYFGVPVDYLLGRTDDPEVIKITPDTRNILADGKVSLEAKGLYMQLSYFAIDGRVKLPDEEEFCKKNGITRKDFDNNIEDLERLGYVRIEKGADGENSKNVYALAVAERS